jgi:hypothetical protein
MSEMGTQRFFAVCWVALLCLFPGFPLLGGEIPTLVLPKVDLKPFGGEIPAAEPIAFSPKMIDSGTTVDKAINGPDVFSFLDITLSASQKEFLDTHKFLLIPKDQTKFEGQLSFSDGGKDWDEMLGLYDVVTGGCSVAEREPQNTHLVTPGVVLHAFHTYLENLVQYLESNDLAMNLKAFLQTAHRNGLAFRKLAKGDLKKRYERISAQLAVPIILLENAQWERREVEHSEGGPPVFAADKDDTLENALVHLDELPTTYSPDVVKSITRELELIYGAQDVAESPLFGGYSPNVPLKCDYTQFTPRSHYSKSSVLRAYFRAMIYLGRNAYILNNPDGLADAILLTHILASPEGNDPAPIVAWKGIMETTTFFAGPADDVSYPQFRDFLEKACGTAEIDPQKVLDPGFLAKVSARLGDLQGPKIFSEIAISPDIPGKTKDDLLQETKAFKIFGQRFSFSGWILSRLTGGEEKSPARLPSTPTSLFVPAVFGDQTALKFIPGFLKGLPDPFSPEEIQGFLGHLTLVQKDLAKIPSKEWFNCIASAWLNVLRTLSGTFGEGYPLYMQSSLFPLLQLETVLGSFAELKHDTLLYEKPVYAECGEGGPEEIPPVPRGFVEPNLQFWRQFQALVDFTREGMKRQGFLSSELEEYGNISRFARQVKFFTRLAEKELKGEEVIEEEYEELRTGTLDYLAEPFFPSVLYDDDDRKSALIADIHTDAVSGQVLYTATGKPYILLVLVGNENQPRLTIGVAFNHYEFTGPLGKRLSDQDWQKDVYNDQTKLPAKSPWYKEIIVK